MTVALSPTASPEYAAIQTQFHKDRPDYGISGRRYVDHVLELAKRMNTRDILDYGCGKATLQKGIPFPIQNYDPFIEEFNRSPEPADLVVCTDVMEHIEPQFTMNVLDDIWRLTKRSAFFQIATTPASKNLPDGRNAHLVIRDPNWWLNNLMFNFNIHHMQEVQGGMIVITSPLKRMEDA